MRNYRRMRYLELLSMLQLNVYGNAFNNYFPIIVTPFGIKSSSNVQISLQLFTRKVHLVLIDGRHM